MSKSKFEQMYLSEWKPISGELYDLAVKCCHFYDSRCDAEQRNYTRISKEEIDDLYGHAVSLGWDQDEKMWRRFCWDRRHTEEYRNPRGKTL